MEKIEITPFNPFDYFETQEDIVFYLQEVLNDDDPMLFVSAINHLAKHKGVDITLADNPTFTAVNDALQALGFRFTVTDS